MLSVLYGVVVPIGLALSMLGMGFTLAPRDFAAVIRTPRAIAIGLCGQLVLLPLAASLIARAVPLEPAIAAGLLILGSCPGGIISNSLVYLARADAALSVALTSISSLLAGLTMPVALALSYRFALGIDAEQIGLPFSATAKQILLVTALPVVAGMVFRATKPQLVAKLEPLMRRLTMGLLAVITIGALALEHEFFARNLPLAGPVTLGLCLSMILIGWGLSRAAKLAPKQTFTVATEIGLQNGALGAFVALTILHDPKLIVVPSVYTIVMLLVGVGAIVLFRRTRGPEAISPLGSAPLGGPAER
jgi:BASS family bile acid:Na+ symporter